jgi:peptidoglycan/xylan/chitin deacetylase (PgdA/CDA1 family)
VTGDRIHENDARGFTIPILMFHGIDSPEQPSERMKPGDIHYVLGEGEFEIYLHELNASGYLSILLEDLVAWQKSELALSKNAIVLTFDDGHITNHTKALPLLRKYGFRAEFFITTGLTGTRHYMNQGQIRDLLAEGMGVASHGVTHRYLTDLSPDKAREELVSSRERLEAIIDAPVVAFSPPGGRISDTIRSMASDAGYGIVCDSSPHGNTMYTPPLALGRFAVTRGMGLPEFMRLAQARKGWKARVWHGLKNIAKNGLGTARYEALRERAMELARGHGGTSGPRSQGT